MDSSLKDKAVKGASWLAIAQVAGQIIKFAVASILGWILSPSEFGLIGMVLIFSGFAVLFNDMGFSAALIQKSEVNERHFSSVFWLNLAAGLTMTGLMILAAPLLARFYNRPELVPLAQWLSLDFLIGSTVIVQRARLTRAIDFRTLSILEVIAATTSGVVGIVLALSGFGVYALVAQILTLSTCLSVLLWMSSKWRPRLIFCRSAIREMLGFSVGIAGGNSLNYWIRNADNLLIGKLLGSTQLGLYARAYMVMLLPVTQITSVLTRVMFPALASIQGDNARTKRIYLRAISTIALFTFPAMLGLLVVADDFVLALFGPKWRSMIPILKVLCIVGLFQSINSTVGWLYTSQGRSDIQFWWILYNGILTVELFAIGITWGIFGVAVAYAIRVVATSWLNFYIPGRLIGMSVLDVIRVLYRPAVYSLVMAGVVACLGWIMPATWSHWLRLALLIATGVAVFGATIHCWKMPAYIDLVRIIRERNTSRKQPVSQP